MQKRPEDRESSRNPEPRTFTASSSLVEEVALLLRDAVSRIEGDCYLTFAEAASYTATSERTLRQVLPEHLRFKVSKRKTILKKSELDSWIEQHRQPAQADVDRLVDEVVREVQGE